MTIRSVDQSRRELFLFPRLLAAPLLLTLVVVVRAFHDSLRTGYRKNIHIESLPIVISAANPQGFRPGVYDFFVAFIRSRANRPDRIVISGFGCLTPLGNSRDELWEGFRHARSGVRRISAFDPSEFPVQIAGEVRDIDPYEFFHAKERPHVSRTAALAGNGNPPGVG